MNLIEATRYCFRNALNFKGRAARYEFWNFVLFIILVDIVLTIINILIFGPTVTEGFQVSIDSNGNQTSGLIIEQDYNSGWFGTVFGLVVLLPFVAVSVRRLHDRGRSAWFLLIPAVGLAIAIGLVSLNLTTAPIDTTGLPADFPTQMPVPQNATFLIAAFLIALGSCVAPIVWFARASQPGPNRFGPNPHEVLQ